MAEDITNLMRAAGNLWGGSSAVPAVMAGIGKKATQMRGQILEARDTALRTIQTKVTDVQRTFEQQTEKINLWKAQQLNDIGREFQSRLDEINAQKAGASQEKAANLSALAMQVFTNAQQRLMALDQAVTNYNLGMMAWREQRQGELQDYIAKLQAYATYSPQSYGYTVPGLGGATTKSNVVPSTWYPTQTTPAPAGTEEEKMWEIPGYTA